MQQQQQQRGNPRRSLLLSAGTLAGSAMLQACTAWDAQALKTVRLCTGTMWAHVLVLLALVLFQ